MLLKCTACSLRSLSRVCQRPAASNTEHCRRCLAGPGSLPAARCRYHTKLARCRAASAGPPPPTLGVLHASDACQAGKYTYAILPYMRASHENLRTLASHLHSSASSSLILTCGGRYPCFCFQTFQRHRVGRQVDHASEDRTVVGLVPALFGSCWQLWHALWIVPQLPYRLSEKAGVWVAAGNLLLAIRPASERPRSWNRWAAHHYRYCAGSLGPVLRECGCSWGGGDDSGVLAIECYACHPSTTRCSSSSS